MLHGARRRPKTPLASVSLGGRRHGGPLGLPAPRRTGSPPKKEGRARGQPQAPASQEASRPRPADRLPPPGRGGGAGGGAPVCAEGSGRAADGRGGVSPGSAPAARPLQGTVRDRDARRGDPQPGPAGAGGHRGARAPKGAGLSAAPHRRPDRLALLPISEQPDLAAPSSVWQTTRATPGSAESRPSSHARFGSEELGFPSPNRPAARRAPPPLPPARRSTRRRPEKVSPPLS